MKHSKIYLNFISRPLRIESIMMTQGHGVTRVRHDARLRILTVEQVERLTPHMTRVILSGDMSGFASAGFDDHMKVFFPGAGEAEPVTPKLGPNGPVFPEGKAPSPMRDFTPRSFDVAGDSLTVDFALHDVGPAAEWAARAQPGQKLGIGGPRGSAVISDDFDWYLLAGDESALPAIGRRLEELRAGVPVIVVVTVLDREEELSFTSRADVTVCWVHRPASQVADPKPLLNAIRGLDLPAGEGFAWIAGESQTAKQVREYLLGERGLNKSWVKAAGYWRGGATGIHDTFND